MTADEHCTLAREIEKRLIISMYKNNVRNTYYMLQSTNMVRPDAVQ